MKLMYGDETIKKVIQKDVKEVLGWDVKIEDIIKTESGNWEIVVK